MQSEIESVVTTAETTMRSGIEGVLSGFDHGILGFYHQIEQVAGSILTPLFTGISYLGNFGIIFIVAAVAMLFFARTRQTAVCMLLAILIGWLLSDVVLKELIARPRPFANAGGELFAWWQQVGAWHESSYSFPSGHTTVTSAAMFAIFLRAKTRLRWLTLIPIVLMAVSRNYLMVHYPTDVIGGILVGLVAALAAVALVRVVYGFFRRRMRGRDRRGQVGS